MAFNTKEQEIIKYGMANGKSRADIERAITKLRTGTVSAPTSSASSKPSEPSMLDRIGNDINNAGKSVESNISGTDGHEGEPVLQRAVQATASGFNAIPAVASEVLPKPARDVIGAIGNAAGKAVNFLADKYSDNPAMQEFVMKYPDAAKHLESVLSTASAGGQIAGDILATDQFAKVTQGAVDYGAKKVDQSLTALTDKTENALSTVSEKAPSVVKRIGAEAKDRVENMVSRGKKSAEDAVSKEARINSAQTPAEATAIQKGLDDNVINAVKQADPDTLSAYKKIVDISEKPGDPSAPLKLQQRPESVAGDVVSKQYKILEDARKSVGKQMDQVTADVSKNQGLVDMSDALSQIDETLNKLGVTVEDGKLLFDKTNLTTPQRSVVQDLYDKVHEAGGALTPSEIWAKDKLFSALQREARLDKVTDIIVNDGVGGKSNLFSKFRDIFSNKLDGIDPRIKDLNGQYHSLRSALDDVEDTLVKSGDYNLAKGVDPANYAMTRLRRAFSDATSAADYSAIAKGMDRIARELGYTGPDAETLMAFAIKMRDLYPKTVPPTGLQGILNANSIAGVAKNVLEAGKAGVVEQQKALRDLIDQLSASK